MTKEKGKIFFAVTPEGSNPTRHYFSTPKTKRPAYLAARFLSRRDSLPFILTGSSAPLKLFYD